MSSDVTVGVKTFFREERLKRCLDSLVGLPFKEVIVTDDGVISDRKREIYRRMSKRINLKLIECPFNAGIGWCRRKVFEETKTPYLLILDDDHVVPRNVFVLKEILEHDPRLGAVSGIWNVYGERYSGASNLYLEGNTLVKDIREKRTPLSYKGIKYYLFDFIANSAIFRMDCLKTYLWDAKYIIGGEHIDFFFAHKKIGKWRFAVTPNVVFIHLKGGNAKYRSYRNSKEEIGRSLDYFKSKWNIKEIKIRRRFIPRRRDPIKSVLHKVIPREYRATFKKLSLTAIRKEIIQRSLKMPLPKPFNLSNTRILAICCYMADRPNLIRELIRSVKEAKLTTIDLVITNNTEAPSCKEAKPYVKYNMPGTTKYASVEKIVKKHFDPRLHQYVMVIDDDVRLSKNFFDKYMLVVNTLGLILSQAAYSKDSNKAFGCNRQIDGAIAHLTSFVEIGPVTCFERRLIPLIPFRGGSPMGWGLDFVWAQICRERKWPMGVVDWTPVQHNLRGTGSYNRERERLLMQKYLSRVRHVPLYARSIVGQVVFEKDYQEELNEILKRLFTITYGLDEEIPLQVTEIGS